MSYRIVIEKMALKFILKQPPKEKNRIMRSIEKVRTEGDICTIDFSEEFVANFTAVWRRTIF